MDSARRAELDRDLEQFKREINLVEFAVSRGFELRRDKSTRRAKVLKHPSGDRILVAQSGRDGHWVYHALGGDERDSGTIVDFVMRREARGDMRAVHAVCREHLGKPRVQIVDYRVEAGELTFMRELVIDRYIRAQLASNSRYLNERGIRPETLSDPRFKETWRVDQRGNVLFPHHDNEGLCGYEVKNRGYTSFAKQGRKTVWRSRAQDKDDRLILTESAIEALSHYQLHMPENARYMSVGGAFGPLAMQEVIASTQRLPENARVELAFNADRAGRQLADRLQPRLEGDGHAVMRHFPAREGYDWNDLLRAREREYIARLKPPNVAMPEVGLER